MRITALFRWLTFTVLMTAWMAASSQSFTFKEYGQEHGLGDLAIRGINQDRNGLLWISTENGVFRYDGSRFIEYGRKQGLLNPLVRTAHIDSRGVVWAGGPGGVYYLRDDRFHELLHGDKPLDMDDGSSLTSLPSGEVLISSIHALYSVVPSGDTWDVKRFDERYPSVPAKIKTYGLLAARDGSVWSGCNQGICRSEGNEFHRFGDAEKVPADRYIALTEDSKGNIWARGDKHMIERPAGSTEFRDVSLGFPFDPRDSTNAALIEDRTGRILTPALPGIARWNGRSWDVIGPSVGLPDSNIQQILVDQEGIVWIGCQGRGLFKWLGYDEWEHWSTGQGIRNPAIFALAIDPQGRVWVGNGETIDVSDAQHHQFRPFPAKLPPHLLALQSAATDADGTLWFGDYSGTLLHIYPKTNTYETIIVPRGIHQLFADSSGTIWVITSKGLYGIPPSGNGKRIPVLEPDAALNKENLKSISESPDKTLWVGTQGGLFHRSASGWHRVQLHNAEIGSQFATVAAGKQGDIWVAGKFGGVARLRVENDIAAAVQIISVPTISSENVNGISIDSRGWVWIANDHGVDVLEGTRWRHFDRDEGLLWNDTNEGALVIDKDGSAWIGTSAGLSHLIHPDAPSRSNPLVARIEEASWGGRELPLDRPSKVAWQAGDLAVDFAVFSYRNEAAVSYRYRLVGLEDDWVSTRNHSVRYPKLPPGKYRLEVVSEDSGLHRISPPATLIFEVKPPWWMTPVAWVLMAIAVLLIAALILRWRLGRLLDMQKRLERLVAERTHALQSERRELLATREVLRQQATRDGLTGLLNRTAILEVLNREWKRAERERSGLAVIIADVDHFKRFNDTYGHIAGDEILVAIAARLKESIREYDSVGRYGGEEFLIVLTGWNRDGGEERLTHLWQSVSTEPLNLGSRPVIVTSSFGVAGFSAAEPATALNDLLIAADQALYRAKALGRNRIEFAHPVNSETLSG